MNEIESGLRFLSAITRREGEAARESKVATAAARGAALQGALCQALPCLKIVFDNRELPPISMPTSPGR
jgi:hypothetical protein